MGKTKTSAADDSAKPAPTARRGARRKRDAPESAAPERGDGAESGGSADSGEGSSFEGALAQLESTVGRLEAGEMPLEEALELFENGVKLSRQCMATLEAAERRIEILVADREDASGWRAQPFEAADDDSFEAGRDEDEGD